LPFVVYQCEECAQAMQGCCSQDCIDVIHLPEEEQKAIRQRSKMAIKFSKSDVTFKNREATQDPLAAIPNLADLTNQKHWQKLPKSKNIEWNPFYPKPVLVNFLSKKTKSM
jgi:UPF0176 protein